MGLCEGRAFLAEGMARDRALGQKNALRVPRNAKEVSVAGRK